MAQTQVRGTQILNSTVQRQDLDTSTVGQAVIAKIIQGSGVALSSTGGDSGTGDVTVTVSPAVPAASSTNPLMDGAVAVGTGTTWARSDHVHPSDTSRLPATAVSSDAGNQSKLGSDSLIYTPGGVNGFISKTAAYTLTLADRNKYIICSGGSWTLTLPAAQAGLCYNLRNDMGISGTTGTITVQPAAGTIDNLSSLALLPQQECLVISDGTNWRTFGLKREVILGTQDITSATASSIVLLPAGFRLFILDFAGQEVSGADAAFYGQISLDGGSTWKIDGYYNQLLYNSSATAAASVSYNSAVQMNLGTLSATAPWGMASLKLYPGATGLNPNWLVDSFYWYNAGAYSQKQQYGGNSGYTGIITALKYYPSGGNIINCHLTVKGVV